MLTIPAIWDGGQGQRSMPCDVILTNQRLIGYVFVTFPRERLFLEALTLSTITNISLRQKRFEPIFRELLVNDGEHKVYIRAPRQKIEALYTALHSTIEDSTSITAATFERSTTDSPAPIYGRQDIRASFDNSPLAILLLFVGGLILEITGGSFWAMTQSSQIGLPLCIAGFVSVIIAIMVRRQRG